MKAISLITLSLTILTSLAVHAELSGQYTMTNCSGNVRGNVALPFIGNGLQTTGENSYINLEVYVDNEGDTILDLNNHTSSFSWPLIALDLDNYKNAKYKISENKISYENKGRSLGMCGADSNLGLSYPCVKKSNETWSFTRKSSSVVIYEATQGEQQIKCELRAI